MFSTAKTLELMHPKLRDAFSRDLGIAQQAVPAGVVDKRSRAADNHWAHWVEFCEAHAVDPWFAKGDDPIPYLQVFATRYRDGRIAPRGKPVRSGTVSDALRAIGSADIRLDEYGTIDFRLSRQMRFYTKEDPPTQRVKPIPIQVVRAIVGAAHLAATSDVGFWAVADMICIAFFFLCRPGEHTVTKDNTPLKLRTSRCISGSAA